MSRGQKQQIGSSNGQQQTMQKRGNRTLGWYLGVQQNNGGNGADEVEDNSFNQQPMRKISLEDSPKTKNGDEQQKKSHRQHHRYFQQQQQVARPRANSSASSVNKKSLNNSNGDQIVQPAANNAKEVDFQKSGAKPVNGKENYWYYDLVSDGYYYEHNGTRGWRKRNAKLDSAIQNAQKGIEEAKLAEQQKKMAETMKSIQPSLNVPPSLINAQQQQMAKFGTTPNNNGPPIQFGGNPMAIKYFDNDGYFYEMASVDGWRRRQPGTTPPNSLASSFGTAQPKAPSPIITAPRRKIQPLQYQAYQQPPPQLNALDLQEMMLIAQQQKKHQNLGQNSGIPCCCNQNQCCPNSTAPACCSTIAAMAAQMVLQKQQQIMAENSSELANKMKKKPLIEGMPNKSPTNQSANQLAHSQPSSNNWQQQFTQKWTPLGIENAPKIGDEKTTSITVGSFDEPYEFYWSGDETSNEVTLPAKSILAATSVSSNDEDGLEEMVQKSTAKKRQSSIAPIGSEASAFGAKNEKRKGGLQIQTRRPDSLKLSCQKTIAAEPYVPISPGEILMNPFGKENAEEMPMPAYMSSSHNFDVDKFISQLPPMPVNPEQVLQSLNNPLRTPIGPPPSIVMEPSTADSPLFTPIHLGKNPWTNYRLPENTWAYP